MVSIIDYFEERVNKFGDNPLLWEKSEGRFQPTTYKETRSQVMDLAAGLIDLGIKKGDRLALLSEGRNKWLISELAILYCGAINVPLSAKLEADQDLIFRLEHSESRMIFVSRNQLPKIREILHELTFLEKIIVLDDIEDVREKELRYSELVESGKKYLENHRQEVEEIKNSVHFNDIANISYTSGTTAQPKGIMLSHRNYTANVEQAFSFIDIPAHFRTLVVLPWDHAFAHTAALYAFMYKGASIASVETGRNQIETLKNFSNNIMEIQPHVLMSVPAMAKNFRKNIEKGIAAKGKGVSTLFNFAMKFAIWYNGKGNDKGKGLKKLTAPLYKLFDKILFQTIRVRFGGNLQFFIGGGALLDIDLQRFFYALGTPMFQGYGLSEAAPIISANTPNHHKLGSSGPIVQNLEVKICDSEENKLPAGTSGEIVVKGENVMLGYWKNQEATNETIKEGWLFTGDLGYLDNEGYLYVLGRFKSLLIGSDGEKYSPEGIEEAIIDHCPLIDQFVLHNNQNPYTIGLIVPNTEKVNQFAKELDNDMSQEEKNREILQEIQKQMAEFKKGGKLEELFPARWLPAASIILPEPFTESNKLLNSTMKVVRRKVEEYFSDEIDYLYTAEGKEFLSDRNKNNLARFIGK
ncbi:long-chain acyl-CoA synthetase [Marinilabilia salmonicolor]|jgi:long-chain acyl-CoA synthetase|uniref:AMP-dependent synthetase/ligase n=1 Tax=Marinilabilia salmonicolor TaxID=989 RepID=UPI000D05B1F4|nr:AMP-binding protein [Marinilabilia salmonicolor]PRZ00213.1 long-chain acyl-CoA synthetase [Marinilabilia salmonicolor]